MDYEGAPPEVAGIVEMVEGPTDELVVTLGESPEAWRGAFALLDHLREGARVTTEACREMGADRETTMQTTSLIEAAALLVFDRHPASLIMRMSLGQEAHEAPLTEGLSEWMLGE